MRISLHHVSLVSLLAFLAPALPAQATSAATPAAKPAAPAAAAQPSDADIQREMDSVRQVVRANRKKIIAGGMDLTTEENQKFWPLYAEYRDSSAKIGDRLGKIIMEYAKNY